jgi:hypothetical protein
MDGTSVISSEHIKVFENALQAMVRFRQAFGRGHSGATFCSSAAPGGSLTH